MNLAGLAAVAQDFVRVGNQGIYRCPVHQEQCAGARESSGGLELWCDRGCTELELIGALGIRGSGAGPVDDAAVVQGRENAAADPEPTAHARGGNAGSTPAGSYQSTEAGAYEAALSHPSPADQPARAVPPPSGKPQWQIETERKAAIFEWEKTIAGNAATIKKLEPTISADDLSTELTTAAHDAGEQGMAPPMWLGLTPSEIDGSIARVLAVLLNGNGHSARPNGNGKPLPRKPSATLAQYRQRYQALLDAPWPVDGLFCLGCVSLLTAKKGIGKSTLFRSLIICLLNAWPFLGRGVSRPVRVLYMPIEGGGMPVILGFQKAGLDPEREDLAIEDEIPSELRTLDQRIGWVKETIQTNRSEFVIVDTLGRFSKLGGNDDYGGTTEIVGELEKLARQTSVHIIYAHHVGKNRSDDADLTGAAIGSAGIETAAQAHLHLRRRGPGIVTIEIGDMRVGDGLPEHLLNWDAGSDTDSLGDPWSGANRAMLAAAKQVIADFFLQVNPDDWWTASQITAELAGKAGRRWVSWALSDMAKAGELEKDGLGKRGSPFKFRKASSIAPRTSFAEAD